MQPFSKRLVSPVTRFLLERLYRELAWAYDAVSWLVSLGRWRAWTRAALPYVKGERVLEVGCGPGHLLLSLAQEGRRVVGCDLSPAMLRQAGRRVRQADGGTPLARARAQALPFTAGTFSTVVCTFPSGYITDRRTWDEFLRLLSPGGRVVVVYGASLGGTSIWRRLARGLLSLGQVSGQSPRLEQARGHTLQPRHQIVPLGDDRVGLLLAERKDGPDTG